MDGLTLVHVGRTCLSIFSLAFFVFVIWDAMGCCFVYVILLCF